MTQAHVDRAVARATGESLEIVRRRGFSTIDPFEPHHEPHLGPASPQVVDWDQLAAERLALFSLVQRGQPVAA